MIHTGTGIVIGVDTHKHVHVAHAADDLRRPLGDYQMPTTAAGHADFLVWARSHGSVQVMGGVKARDTTMPGRQDIYAPRMSPSTKSDA